MSKPREFWVQEFVWSDGSLTYTPMQERTAGSFLMREVMPDNETELLRRKLDVAIGALKKIKNGEECSACSCACHNCAGQALAVIVGEK